LFMEDQQMQQKVVNASDNNSGFGSYQQGSKQVYPQFQNQNQNQNQYPQFQNQNQNQNQNQSQSQNQKPTTDVGDFPSWELHLNNTNDPRQYFPNYSTGNYEQKMEHLKDEKLPVFPIDSYFIVPNPKNAYMPSITTLELNCPDSNVIIGKGLIKSSQPIIFDYANQTMRVITPQFKENRILLKDGTSVLNGYKINDADSNEILIRNKVTLNLIEIDLSKLTKLVFSGDCSEVFIEDGFFEDKDAIVKIRGLSKIKLGVSKVKNLKIDSQLASIDSTGITKN